MLPRGNWRGGGGALRVRVRVVVGVAYRRPVRGVWGAV